MARGRARPGRRLTEISEVIVAEWFRVLPDIPGDPITDMDQNSLTAAFSEIVNLNDPGLSRHKNLVEAVLDKRDEPLKILVPLPPFGVTSKLQLQNYLEDNDDFIVGMATATLFGCGR
jgi:hypothetical protein